MKIFLGFLVLFFVWSCSSEQKSTEKQTVDNLVQYAQHFSIKKDEGVTVLTIYSPETHQVEQTWVVPEVPYTKVGCFSSTHIGMLEKLGMVDRVGAITNALYVHNPTIQEKVKRKQVMELGEETQIPVENLIKTGCQAVFYSGFGKEFPHAKTLEKLGVSCIVNYDWRENHPLGKAEWILVFGYLMGKPAEAHAIFQEIVREYKAEVERAKSISVSKKVISGNMWGDAWNAPAGESYNAVLLKDAGFDYIYSNTKGTGSVSYTLEKITADCEGVDIWLNTGVPTKKLIVTNHPKMAFLPPYQNNGIFDYSRAGNRFWEMSAIEPHHVLSDYINIRAGKNLNSLYFYHRVE